ncbi:MAG: Crp/Fnr family transcriptional regulator [Deltaproteobacteria bacterium]|nr:Crp/Fnr family transcriptional regulator [Deltaproteobacteria bacterium]
MTSGEILSKIFLFSDLNKYELNKLSSLMSEKVYKKGENILIQNDKGDSLYVILEGKVKVVLYGEKGREIILSILEDGDFFGEMALLDEDVRSAYVITLERTRVLVLPREVFLEWLYGHPAFTVKLLKYLSKRLRQADGIISNLSLLDAYGRVARFIIDLVKKEGRDIGNEFVIDNRPTHNVIASQIGTTRETVTRSINDFIKRGIIRQSGRMLFVKKNFIQSELSK